MDIEKHAASFWTNRLLAYSTVDDKAKQEEWSEWLTGFSDGLTEALSKRQPMCPISGELCTSAIDVGHLDRAIDEAGALPNGVRVDFSRMKDELSEVCCDGSAACLYFSMNMGTSYYPGLAWYLLS